MRHKYLIFNCLAVITCDPEIIVEDVPNGNQIPIIPYNGVLGGEPQPVLYENYNPAISPQVSPNSGRQQQISVEDVPGYGYVGGAPQPVFYDNYNPAEGPPVSFNSELQPQVLVEDLPLSPSYGYAGGDPQSVFYEDYNTAIGPQVGYPLPEQPYQPAPQGWNGNLPPQDWYPNYMPANQQPNYPAVVSNSWPVIAEDTWQEVLVPGGQMAGAYYPPQNYPAQPWDSYVPNGQRPDFGPRGMDFNDPCQPEWQPPDDCQPEQPEVAPDCRFESCNRICIRHMGDKKVGACFNNICHCMDIFVPGPGPKPTPKPQPEPQPEPKEEDWTYGNQHEWPIKYPDCSKGPQSPARVEPENIRDLSQNLKFIDYNAPISFLIENTGKMIRMFVQGVVIPSVKMSREDGDQDWHASYTLAFIDLHWDSSEHEVKGQRLRMEAQFHHYNPWFDSYEDAVEHPGQTMVIAILFQAHPTDTDLDGDIFKIIADLKVPDEIGIISPTKAYLQGLPSTLGSSFGVYKGSESHPPCRPGVYWLIAQQTYRVAKDKLHTLQSLQDVNGKPILRNMRNLATKSKNNS